jgi:hypothetical protein
MMKAIRCFSNVTLLPLPPYSPELNPVEQLWQQIKQRFLSNTTFALSLEHQKYIRIQIAADELPLGLVPFSAHILVIEPCCPILVSS